MTALGEAACGNKRSFPAAWMRDTSLLLLVYFATTAFANGNGNLGKATDQVAFVSQHGVFGSQCAAFGILRGGGNDDEQLDEFEGSEERKHNQTLTTTKNTEVEEGEKYWECETENLFEINQETWYDAEEQDHLAMESSIYHTEEDGVEDVEDDDILVPDTQPVEDDGGDGSRYTNGAFEAYDQNGVFVGENEDFESDDAFGERDQVLLEEAELVASNDAASAADEDPVYTDVLLEDPRTTTTDDDSSAFVDRMDFADAYDEGDTTTGSLFVDDQVDYSLRPAGAISPGGGAEDLDDEVVTLSGEPKEDSPISSAGSQESKSGVSKVPKDVEQVLVKELNYHRVEVRKLRPEFASIAAKKRLQRPNEGAPPNWFVGGDKGKRNAERAIAVKKVVPRVAVTVALGVLVYFRQSSIGFIMSALTSLSSKVASSTRKSAGLEQASNDELESKVSARADAQVVDLTKNKDKNKEKGPRALLKSILKRFSASGNKSAGLKQASNDELESKVSARADAQIVDLTKNNKDKNQEKGPRALLKSILKRFSASGKRE